MSLFIKQVGLPTVENVNLGDAGTEVAIDLGPFVKKFLVQVRGTEDLQVSFEEGKSNTKFFTLKGSSVYFEDFVHAPITLYVQSPSPDVTVEVVTWISKD